MRTLRDWNAIFTDWDMGNVWQWPSPFHENLGGSEGEDIEKASAGTCMSSYDGQGEFENCFHIRNMDYQRHMAAMRLLPVAKNYRAELERYAERGEGECTIVCSLADVAVFDNCLKLVVEKIRIMPFEEPLRGHLNLFVSRDYRCPPLGSLLRVRGYVYAYPMGKRRQLGVDVYRVELEDAPAEFDSTNLSEDERQQGGEWRS